MNKKLETKIIDYLRKLEKNEISSPISSKKKNLLLTSKNEYEKLDQEVKECQELSQEASQEEQNYLLVEIKNLEEKKSTIINKIKEQIIEEEGIKQNAKIEIRPGTGGTEARLFAHDLYQMYYKFAESKGWKVESEVDNKGNFTFLVKGKGAFNWLKNEAGVHRVQRVPKTENEGRLHTSTASVVVLPEARDIALNIRSQDLKIDTKRASGAGGQHVNTTDSAVRITHLPTGIVATSQDGRSQHDNKEKALFILKSRLLKQLQIEKAQEVGNLRSAMIGTAERAEKIRTYNYKQDRVTDHRVNQDWYNLDYIIEGDLEEILLFLKLLPAFKNKTII